MQRILFYLCSSVLIGDCFLCAGCQTTETSAPSDARKTQESALADPYSYGSDAKSIQKPPGKYDDVDPTDVSGGGTTQLNKRAMQRDLDAVFGK